MLQSLTSVILGCFGIMDTPNLNLDGSGRAEITNDSNFDWKIIITDARTGGLALTNVHSTQTRSLVLDKVGHSMILPRKSAWICDYFDAPSTLTSKKSERLHTMYFCLRGPDRKEIELLSFRNGAPDSNVWVGYLHANRYKGDDRIRKLNFNAINPGDIVITEFANNSPATSYR